MSVTYEVKAAGGFHQAIIRTRVQDQYVGEAALSEGGKPDVRLTVVEQAVVAVFQDRVVSDGVQAFRTGNASATPQQIIQALRDDVFRPTWSRVDERKEPI